ncbi:MAG: Mur ligase family protein, partial [Solirubrobacteraceae bacterium]|nr:Mur ligase family protein [Solirubrobacteraceae bacterium]
MKLAALASLVPGARLEGDPSVTVAGVGHDSRITRPGELFVAIRGERSDGNAFVEAALRKGAVAVASEQPPRPGSPWLQVPDAREALAILSAAVLGQPARELTLVGVTGTNGKTTTTFLVDAALRAAGHRVGLVGTVQYRVGDRLAEAVRTTPEASELQGYFQEMRAAGCSHAVLEVSSHSLEMKRVHGCAFAVAVFTNLTRDHLDFHGDMDRYFAAKRKLFEGLLREDGHAVLNADDPRAASLRDAIRRPVLTYGVRAEADLRAEAIELGVGGTRFQA